MSQDHVDVLWVDDQLASYTPYIRALEKHGARVEAALSAQEGVYSAQKRQFDLILVDLSMPGMSGIDFLKEVHPLQKSAHIAVFSSYLYLSRYRDGLREIGFPVTLLDKVLPTLSSPARESEFVAPILRLACISPQREGLWKRFVDATELKPGIAGFCIDLKKLAEQRTTDRDEG